jgi:hypothetical protein
MILQLRLRSSRPQSQFRLVLITSTLAMAAPSALSIVGTDVYPKLSSLPIIDISPYLSVGNRSKRISTSAALHAACLEYGFFYLDISQYVDPMEPEELTQLARQFFALPEEEKNQIALRNEDGARGTPARFSCDTRSAHGVV